jgi:opacity protein-like surface antigen
MKLIAIAAASAMLLAAGAAQAQMARGTSGNVYGELGYTSLKIQESGFSSNKPGVLRGIVGFNLNQNIAFEGLAGFGVRKDNSTSTFNGVPVNIESDVRHMFGVYVKPKIVLGSAFELFGRVGVASTRLRSSANVAGFTASDSSSGSDVSYGLGANFNIAPTAYVGVDYMRYYNKNDVKLDGVTVSVGLRF